MKSRHLVAAVSLVFTLAFLSAAQAAEQPMPSPKWQPVQVVSLQLEALRENNAANDEGIAAAYKFASTRNKQAVGDLANFRRMLRGGYPDMLTHVAADIETVKLEDDEAVIGVTLKLSSKSQHKYLFLLRRNDGEPCDGCWLTDGVIPVQRAEPPPLRQI